MRAASFALLSRTRRSSLSFLLETTGPLFVSSEKSFRQIDLSTLMSLAEGRGSVALEVALFGMRFPRRLLPDQYESWIWDGPLCTVLLLRGGESE